MRLHQRRNNMHRHGILSGIAHRFHVHRFAIQLEMADNQAIPQIQHLMDVRQIIRPGRHPIGMRQHKTDLAEVQPVRVFAEPLVFRRRLAGGDIGVRHGPAIQVGVLLEFIMINVPAVRIRNGVPAPVGKGPQRRGLGERFREGLQAGGIHGESKLPIAHG